MRLAVICAVYKYIQYAHYKLFFNRLMVISRLDEKVLWNLRSVTEIRYFKTDQQSKLLSLPVNVFLPVIHLIKLSIV